MEYIAMLARGRRPPHAEFYATKHPVLAPRFDGQDAARTHGIEHCNRTQHSTAQSHAHARARQPGTHKRNALPPRTLAPREYPGVLKHHPSLDSIQSQELPPCSPFWMGSPLAQLVYTRLWKRGACESRRRWSAERPFSALVLWPLPISQSLSWSNGARASLSLPSGLQHHTHTRDATRHATHDTIPDTHNRAPRFPANK